VSELEEGMSFINKVSGPERAGYTGLLHFEDILLWYIYYIHGCLQGRDYGTRWCFIWGGSTLSN